MIFLRAYSHVLVQKSGAIQNPADIDEFFSPQTWYFNAGLGRSRLCIW